MILDLFLYFAKFPQFEGVTRIASKGDSDMPGYAEILQHLESLTEHSIVPDIENYVYGQSLKDLETRIDRLVGTFLFVDYGEMNTSVDHAQSVQVKERLAITVAMKLGSSSDALEQVIASDRTLRLLSTIYARLLFDVETGEFVYADRSAFGDAEFIPFVSSSLSSYGWTLMLTISAPDALGFHEQYKSFMRKL